MARETLARAAFELGERDAAQTLAFDALTIASDLGYHYGPGGGVSCLDVLAITLDDPQVAARLLGAVDARLAAVEQQRPPSTRAAYDAAMARLRADLGDELDALLADGAQLSVEDAAAYALRGRGRRGRPASGWESLTPAELQVVELVAQGLSNPQIGERLFVSRKTVTSHLGHVFAKLGVSSRAELSAEAARRGL
jgi:DNA-binding CsgD family transcriptional regulator